MVHKKRVQHFVFVMLFILILSPISTNVQMVAAEPSEKTGEKVLNQDKIDRFMKLINDFRAEECLPPVSYNYDIQDGMDIRVKEITQKFDHIRPNGEPFSTAFSSDSDVWLENIAAGPSSPESVFEAWKNSPGHRANMLTFHVESIGLGFDGGYWAFVGAGHTKYTTNYEEVSEVIDYETIIKENPGLDQGVENVIKEGQNGSKTINYEQYLDTENKVVFQCAKTESQVKAPVNEIVEIGTKITEVKEEVKEIEIPFKTIEQEDPTLDKGKKVIQQEGKNGQKITTYKVTYVNGEEESREVIKEETVEAVDEIILIGTKVTIVSEEEEEIKDIAFETIVQEDPTLEKGKKVVQQEGKNGQDITTYKVTYVNGEEESREVVREETVEAVDEIVLIGTKVIEAPVVKEDKEEQEQDQDETNPVIEDDEVENNGTPTINGEADENTVDGKKLPETATTIFKKLLIGIILLGIGGGALYLTRRKEIIE